MVEMVSRPYATAFEKFAAGNPDILCLSADLTSSCEIDGFRDRHPDQFLSLGMAEQNMMSFAGGLGLAGFRPFLHTFGVFMYRRPYDQLVASIAYPRRKVRLMGFLPGVTTPGGMTHQSIEDISVMRSIPNMTILETGDATEVESICQAADSIDGPVWCRVLRGSVRACSTPRSAWAKCASCPKAMTCWSSPLASAPKRPCAPVPPLRGPDCRSGICICTRSSPLTPPPCWIISAASGTGSSRWKTT